MKNYSLIAHEDSTELVYNDNSHVTGVCYIPLDKGESILKSHLYHHFVIFILKGQAEISCKHYTSKVVGQGYMTFVSKGGYLEITAHGVNSSFLIFGFDEITIRTSESLMDFFTTHGNKKQYVHNTLPVKADMKQIVDRIVSQLRKGRIKNPEICLAWNLELFFTFISYYTKTQVTEFFRPLVSTDMSFRDFVENNYMEVEGNAEKLIQYSGMKRHVFIKEFKQEFGTTPKDWLTSKFKQSIEHYAGRPNATTTFVASKLNLTVTRLCQLTRKYYDCTPQQLIDRMKSAPQQN